MSAGPPPRTEYESRRRPLGVTVIGILEVLAGIIGILGSITIFFASGISGAVAGGFAGGVAGFAAGFFIGGFALLVALITLAVGFGLLRGSGWAWTVAVIISFINLLIGIIDIAGGSIRSLSVGFLGSTAGLFGAIGTIVISLIVLIYLYRPNVKGFFGKR
jgi:hypothetical protein